MFGVGFLHKLINKGYKKEIVDFTAISNRLCKIRIKSRYSEISIINVHSPTEEKEDEEIEQFYEEIDGIYNQIPRYDVKIIIGGFNAKLEREEIYKPIVGDHLVSTRKVMETEEN